MNVWRVEAYRKAYSIALLGITSIFAVYTVGQFSRQVLNVISDGLFEFLGTLLFISAFTLARRYRWQWKGVIPKVWIVAGFSAMFIFTAITIQNMFKYTGLTSSHLQMTTILFLLALCLAVYALSLYIKTFKEALRGKTVLTVATAIIFTGLASTYLVLQPLMSVQKYSIEGVLTATFIFIEFVLFYLAVMGICLFSGGRLAKAWFFLSLGIVLIMAGNLIVFYISATEIYTGLFGNMCISSGLILTTLAFYIHRIEI